MKQPQLVWKCPYCGEIFDTIPEWEDHAKIHRRRYTYRVVSLNLNVCGSWFFSCKEDWTYDLEFRERKDVWSDTVNGKYFHVWSTNAHAVGRIDDDVYRRLVDAAQEWLRDTERGLGVILETKLKENGNG